MLYSNENRRTKTKTFLLSFFFFFPLPTNPKKICPSVELCIVWCILNLIAANVMWTCGLLTEWHSQLVVEWVTVNWRWSSVQQLLDGGQTIQFQIRQLNSSLVDRIFS